MTKLTKTPFRARGVYNKKRYRKKYVKPTAKVNAKQIASLTSGMAKLKEQVFGQKQYTRQWARSLTALPNGIMARVSANFPVAFCHQNIQKDANVYQVGLAPITGQVESQIIANFIEQSFPLLTLDPLSVKFDQLQYVKKNSIGVQPGYKHMFTSYNVHMYADNWRGWAEILIVTPKKQYTRQAAPDPDDFQLPSGLPGFANCCGGTTGVNAQYSYNPLFYSVKCLKRVYFNTFGQLGDQPAELHTNPNMYVNITVTNDKARSHIRAQASYDQTNPVIPLDIALDQQDWIVFTSSNTRPALATSSLNISVQRCPVWRDPVGSS